MSRMHTPRAPRTMGSWLLYAWGTHTLPLLGVNLLFLVACIPVVTIPAALCALHAVVQRYYRERFAESMSRLFRREFLEAFFQRTLLILGVLAVPLAAVVLLRDLLSATAWLVLSAVLLLFALVALSWFIPQLVLLNLRPVQAMKNACIFTLLETKANFVLMAIHAVELTVMIFTLPTSVFLLLLLPVFHTVLVTGIVMPVLQKHLVHDEPTES